MWAKCYSNCYWNKVIDSWITPTSIVRAKIVLHSNEIIIIWSQTHTRMKDSSGQICSIGRKVIHYESSTRINESESYYTRATLILNRVEMFASRNANFQWLDCQASTMDSRQIGTRFNKGVEERKSTNPFRFLLISMKSSNPTKLDHLIQCKSPHTLHVLDISVTVACIRMRGTCDHKVRHYNSAEYSLGPATC